MFHPLRRRIALSLRQRPLLPFLLAATVALDGALIAADTGNDRALGFALLFAQVGLLGVWAGQLQRGWFTRCVVALAVSALLCVVFFMFSDRPPLGELLTVLLTYVAVIATASAATRFAGRLLFRRPVEANREPTQFSIRGILSATTTVAIGFTLLRYAALPGGDIMVTVLACCSLALLPLLAYEVVRRTRTWLAASVLVGITSALCGALFIASTDIGGRKRDTWFIAILLQGVFYLIWMLGVRVRGRSPRRHRVSETHEEPPRLMTEESNELESKETQPQPLDFQA